MKKTLLCLFVVLCVFILTNCSAKETDSILANQNASHLQSTQESVETNLIETKNEISYGDYGAYKDKTFQQLLLDNPIDKAFHEEYNKAVGPENSGDNVIEVYRKYIDIWQDEMQKSSEWLCELLNAENEELFLTSQDDFEKSLSEDMQFSWNTLQEISGTSFHELWLDNYLNKYRDRTFEIKYIAYRLENNSSISNNSMSSELKPSIFYYE